MKKLSKISLLSFVAAAGLSSLPAGAAPTNPFYADGDLVIAFQKPGNLNTVYASLGNAATLYRRSAAGVDGTNQVDFLDLSSVLTSAFGAGWATDPGVYAGLAGVFSTSGTSTVLTNGDPARTLYISSPRTAVGTVGTAESTGWDLGQAGNTAVTAVASGIQTQNNVFKNNYDVQAVVSPTSLSQIDEQNPFLAPGIQDNAFNNTLEGGVQQVGSATSFGTFGAAGSVEFALDLFRVLAKNNLAGQVAGDLRVGSYEGTITVGSNGKVSFMTQGTAPSSAYDGWLGGFPQLATTADKLPETDFDNDGFSNLEEFVLNGNPAVSDESIAPTLDASGANFVFSFTRRDDSVTEAPALFQYGSDLVGWTSVAVATGGTVGLATVVVTAGGAVTDGVSVTVPKTQAVDGKLFGRLKIVK
ncbi:hypothetical protein HQ447_03490 [bacterium]|nr:hypothetical protein [bacterium]